MADFCTECGSVILDVNPPLCKKCIAKAGREYDERSQKLIADARREALAEMDRMMVELREDVERRKKEIERMRKELE